MIPPFLATMGGKIGAGLLSLAVIAGVIYAYNESLRSQGDARTEARFTEQIQEQASTAQLAESRQDEQRLKDVERTVAEKDKFNEKLIRENRAKDAEIRRLTEHLSAYRNQQPEVIHEVQYVEIEKPAPCVVPEHLLDAVDGLARLLNEIPYDRVSDGREAAGEPALQRSDPVACHTLVDRIELLTARLGTSMIEHRGLSEYALNQHAIYEAWRKGQAERK